MYSSHGSSTGTKLANRTLLEWFTSWPSVILLVLSIILSSGTIIHSQLLRIGEHTWNDYFLLRGGDAVQQPACDRNQNIDAAVAAAVAKKKADIANDPLAGLLGTTVNEADIRQSIISSQQICQSQWQRYDEIQSRITWGVEAYSTFETGVAYVVTQLGNYQKLILALLVLICAAAGALTRHHISLRPIRTVKDYYVSTTAQLFANGILMFSSIMYTLADLNSIRQGVQVDDFYLHYVWDIGFGILALISLIQLCVKPRDLEDGGTWGGALLTVPLYAVMCFAANVEFFSEQYWQGTMVYFNLMMEFATLFLNLALYGWVGMLLTQTRMMHLLFDVLRPWKMSPELLSLVVLLIVAVPTAYTGASGIFVLAAGAVIYNELRRGGARKQLALGATAMSGSMGVVLAPCLLMVIIAALNKDVTTDELFHSGYKLFILTAILYFLISQLFRTEAISIAPVREALPESIRRIKPLIPYFVVFIIVLVFFSFALNRGMDEFSAPIILPVALLAILAYEYLWKKQSKEELEEAHHDTLIGEKGDTFEEAVRVATNQTCGPIGALLLLMALSVSSSGIIERLGLMDMLPDSFGSKWVAMTVVMCAMILVGMFMDPYGAIIVVNATIFQIAKKNGLDPLHFWMMSLMCFELGYLTPPIALNHLLARQVIGYDEVASAKLTEGSFWRRYEKFLLPICVILPSLLLVAYLPLASQHIHDWVFQRIAVPQ
jgi:TRAP-type C4-dicarboxylate transport system permease large subunit